MRSRGNWSGTAPRRRRIMDIFGAMKVVGLALLLAGPAMAQPLRVCASFAVQSGGPVSMSVDHTDRVTRIMAPLTEQGQGSMVTWTEPGAFDRVMPLFAEPRAWHDDPRIRCASGQRFVLSVQGAEGLTAWGEASCPTRQMAEVLLRMQDAVPAPDTAAFSLLGQAWADSHDPCGRP